MVKAAAKMGWIDEDRIVCEMAASAYRAGVSIYLTYYAKELARSLLNYVLQSDRQQARDDMTVLVGGMRRR